MTKRITLYHGGTPGDHYFAEVPSTGFWDPGNFSLCEAPLLDLFEGIGNVRTIVACISKRRPKGKDFVEVGFVTDFCGAIRVFDADGTLLTEEYVMRSTAGTIRKHGPFCWIEIPD